MAKSLPLRRTIRLGPSLSLTGPRPENGGKIVLGNSGRQAHLTTNIREPLKMVAIHCISNLGLAAVHSHTWIAISSFGADYVEIRRKSHNHEEHTTDYDRDKR